MDLEVQFCTFKTPTPDVAIGWGEFAPLLRAAVFGFLAKIAKNPGSLHDF